MKPLNNKTQTCQNDDFSSSYENINNENNEKSKNSFGTSAMAMAFACENLDENTILDLKKEMIISSCKYVN